MLDLYKRRLLANGTYMGDALKKQSDMIMDNTFTRDIAYRKVLINDEYVDAKYIIHTYYTISKDAVDYHLQFRPGVHYPIGTYVDIPDDVGTYNKWLIVARSDEPQFVKYNVLKCNWTFKWMDVNVVHECIGVLRMRNSYNSGVWHDYLTTTLENQNQFIVPTTPETQTINYNTRFLISDNQINPIAWEVSKREDTFPVGVTFITVKQVLFNPNWDNKELMIAGYYKNQTTQDSNTPEPEKKITYSGLPFVKVGGSFKTFTLEGAKTCTWKISGIDEKNLIIEIPENSNQIKIKVKLDYTLIGALFSLEAYNDDLLLDSMNVEVRSL